MKEMLEFSATHKCFPQVWGAGGLRLECLGRAARVTNGAVLPPLTPLQVEVLPFTEANEGFHRIEANSARYRVVLKIEGFRESQVAAAASSS